MKRFTVLASALLLGALALGAIALSLGSVEAADGFADQTPITVLPTPTAAATPSTPSSYPTTTEGKTNANGNFFFDIKHGAKRKASDLHVTLLTPTGKDYRISWVQRQNPLNGADDRSEDGRTISTDATDAATDTFDDGETLALGILVEKKDKDGVFQDFTNKTIKLGIWLTRDTALDTVISAYSPNHVGDVAMSATTIPGANTPTLAVVGDNDEIALNPVLIGESSAYRFGNGTLLFTPDQGNCAFEIPADGDPNFPPLEIRVYDEGGNVVCNRAEIGISNPRVDDEGNFLVDVWRKSGETSPVVLSIKGLKLRGATTATDPTAYTATLSGAPLKGYALPSGYVLVKVTPE